MCKKEKKNYRQLTQVSRETSPLHKSFELCRKTLNLARERLPNFFHAAISFCTQLTFLSGDLCTKLSVCLTIFCKLLHKHCLCRLSYLLYSNRATFIEFSLCNPNKQTNMISNNENNRILLLSRNKPDEDLQLQAVAAAAATAYFLEAPYPASCIPAAEIRWCRAYQAVK